MKDLKSRIEKVGYVSAAIKDMYFYDVEFCDIRTRLEELGLDRHMLIELRSVEVAVVTPNGIIMQLRPEDDNQLGVVSGILEDGEQPVYGAIRKLKEELGIVVKINQLQYFKTITYTTKYKNGDRAMFTTWRFVLELKSIPKLTEKSTVISSMCPEILEHQQTFVKKSLRRKK